MFAQDLTGTHTEKEREREGYRWQDLLASDRTRDMRACVRVCVQNRFEIGEWLRFNALNGPTTDRRVAVPGLLDQA